MGAAVGVGAGTEERVELLVEAGVDVIVVDTAHGHSKGVIDRVRWVKQNFPQVEVIGGNIATGAAARGAGRSRCRRRQGRHRPRLDLHHPHRGRCGRAADHRHRQRAPTALKGTGVPMIADGGIRYSGDIAKAMAAGADTRHDGRHVRRHRRSAGRSRSSTRAARYKCYRGMGSHRRHAGRAPPTATSRTDRQANADKLVPEGIEGRVPYKGSVLAMIYQMMGGLRCRRMGYCGCATIAEMHEQGRVRRDHLAPVSANRHVHDVQITKEAPNYRAD